MLPEETGESLQIVGLQANIHETLRVEWNQRLIHFDLNVSCSFLVVKVQPCMICPSIILLLDRYSYKN